MEVSFKFNNGETGAEMVSAILALFGATQPVNVVTTISHADNPAAGGDDDHGPVNSGTHDTEGFPWDARIHSDKKTVTDKGVWRKRKGTPPQQVAAVQAELRSKGLVIAAAGAPAPAPAPAPAAAPVQQQIPAATQQPLPLPGAQQAMPPLGGVPLVPVQETPYQKFVNFVAGHMQTAANPTGRLTSEWVAKALATYGAADASGVGHIQLLEHADPMRVQQIHAAFAQALGVAV